MWFLQSSAGSEGVKPVEAVSVDINLQAPFGAAADHFYVVIESRAKQTSEFTVFTSLSKALAAAGIPNDVESVDSYAGGGEWGLWQLYKFEGVDSQILEVVGDASAIPRAKTEMEEVTGRTSLTSGESASSAVAADAARISSQRDASARKLFVLSSSKDSVKTSYISLKAALASIGIDEARRDEFITGAGTYNGSSWESYAADDCE